MRAHDLKMTKTHYNQLQAPSLKPSHCGRTQEHYKLIILSIIWQMELLAKIFREISQELEDSLKMLPTWVIKLWAPFRPSSSPVLNKNITACLNPAHWEIPRASSNITAIHELQSPAPSLEHPWKLFWSNKVGFGIYKDIFASINLASGLMWEMKAENMLRYLVIAHDNY